jgi:hypothetical protein
MRRGHVRGLHRNTFVSSPFLAVTLVVEKLSFFLDRRIGKVKRAVFFKRIFDAIRELVEFAVSVDTAASRWLTAQVACHENGFAGVTIVIDPTRIEANSAMPSEREGGQRSYLLLLSVQ